MQIRTIRKPIKIISKNPQYSTKKGWYTIGGKRLYLKSSWESRYAHFLEWCKKNGLILEWEYESQKFLFDKIKSGTRVYTPDFKVYGKMGDYHFVEVKGFMDAKSQTKIKRFRKYFPNERLIVIEKDWFGQWDWECKNFQSWSPKKES